MVTLAAVVHFHQGGNHAAVGLGGVVWSEVAEGSVHTRAIELDTRALEPGTYQIRVTIETDEGHIARAYRTLHVVGAG